jgi:hypothetical protein
MFTPEQDKRLRARIAHVLATPACADIRFRIGDIHIGSLMLNYVGGAFLDPSAKLNLVPRDSPGYKNITWTLFMNEGVRDATIVHECTHILINHLNKGQSIPNVTHEAAAYIAEAYWAINAGRPIDIDDVFLTLECGRLAHMAKAYNELSSDCFVFEPGHLVNLKPHMDRIGYDDLNESELQFDIY